MKSYREKLNDLVKLATDCNWRMNQTGDSAAVEAHISATLDNLKEMRLLIPMLESDIKALSSL